MNFRRSQRIKPYHPFVSPPFDALVIRGSVKALLSDWSPFFFSSVALAKLKEPLIIRLCSLMRYFPLELGKRVENRDHFKTKKRRYGLESIREAEILEFDPEAGIMQSRSRGPLP